MANIDFLPRRLDRAFDRLAFPEAAKALMVLHGNPSYNSWWDDFLGDQLDAKMPAAAGTNGSIAVSAAVNGIMRLASNTSDNDSAGAALGLHWNGDNGLYFICRFQLDTIATSKFEVGVTDVATDDGAVNSKATPTFTATDCAVLARDTDDDTNVTFLSNGGDTDGNADWSGTFSAATYYIAEIVVQDNNASGFINGQLVGGGNIEGGNSLTPWVYVQSRAASATRNLDVDYWGIIGPRT